MITPHRQIMLDSDTVAGLAWAVAEVQAVACLEIGTYLATGSTVILGGLMAAAGGRVYCVDPFDRDISALQKDPSISGDHFALVAENIAALRLDPVAHLVRRRSLDAAPLFRDRSLCLVYVDGMHDEQSVREDLAAWGPKVRPGGIICGDDFFPENGVTRAVSAALPGYRTRGRFWWSVRP